MNPALVSVQTVIVPLSGGDWASTQKQTYLQMHTTITPGIMVADVFSYDSRFPLKVLRTTLKAQRCYYLFFGVILNVPFILQHFSKEQHMAHMDYIFLSASKQLILFLTSKIITHFKN
ncbi:hypothetical protein CEXT_277811 [Caerostris extrusa]|uniref:Uncharacterized protein n=1 Tax=Caerostris extrusa TaxID=172846 RepID=A0AAV4TUK3_CAEEX|nr:hypothetical protein CEXT_277811 [Caerostris extrusa]